MRVFGIAGWSGSGKTTLLERLIPVLVGRGISVSTVKHAHHGFDLDTPGKDSFRHRAAGATEVMIGSAARWALMHELRAEAEPTLEDLLARMSPVDLVLVEGFKRGGHAKLEVLLSTSGKPPLFREDPRVVAVVGDVPPPDCPLPWFDRDAIDSVAAFILAGSGLAEG